jgi:phenylacetate-CoA ligase
VRADQFFFRYCVYLPATWIRGQNVAGHLGVLRKTERIAPAERRKLQEMRLARLLQAARSGVPEYSRRLAHLRDDSLSLPDLATIAPLTKQNLRDLHEELRYRPQLRFTVAKTTGGSTGEPVTVHKTHTAMAWELAATWRGYAWAGVDIGDLQARFWGVPLSAAAQRTARLTDFICHRRRFSAFNFDRGSFEQYDQQLRANPPDYFYGYVSMIAELARWYADTGRRLEQPPRAVITTSEVLSPDDRSAIEAAFQCRVFNEYGCGELGTIAHECEHGRLHTSDENMIIEILDGDRPCEPGEKGEIVVTELNNIAMPLIRYRTGDFGALGNEPCPCGRTLGVLSDVFGRAYDFIVSPDGRRFHAEFLVYIFEEAQRQKCGIAQFRVEQTAPDHLHLLVVPSESGFPEPEELRLVARIHELLGANMRVTTSRVQRIQREASGKMRVIVGLQSSSPRQAPDAATRHA